MLKRNLIFAIISASLRNSEAIGKDMKKWREVFISIMCGMLYSIFFPYALVKASTASVFSIPAQKNSSLWLKYAAIYAPGIIASSMIGMLLGLVLSLLIEGNRIISSVMVVISSIVFFMLFGGSFNNNFILYMSISLIVLLVSYLLFSLKWRNSHE
jgi:hypothetical protein